MLPRPPRKAAAAFKGCWRLLRAPAAVLGSFIHQRNAFNTPRVRRNTPRVCRQLHPPAQCRPRVQPSGAVGARRHALCSMAWQRKRPFWQQPVRGRCREPLRIAPKGPRSNFRNIWTKRRPGGGDDMGIYMHVHARRLHVHKHIHTQTRKLCSWAGLHPMRLCAYKEYRYIHECMDVYKNAHIHTNIHTYTYAYIQTYVDIYTCAERGRHRAVDVSEEQKYVPCETRVHPPSVEYVHAWTSTREHETTQEKTRSTWAWAW